MAKVPTLQPLVRSIDTRTAAPGPKTVDPHYLGLAHRAWRETVIANAGARCEWVEGGQRCEKSIATGHRLFADHVKERRDGGSPLDPANGQCLCGAHHTLKTALTRAARLRG